MVFRDEIRKLIKESQNEPFEHYYPHEKEKLYVQALQLAKEAKNDRLVKEIFWEIDLLNRTFGHVTKDRKKEISDKWGWIIENRAFGKLFENDPFCKWDKEALDYYMMQLQNLDLKNPLQKARYAYAVWVFTNEIRFAERCVDLFLQTARLYIRKQWYAQSYEIVPFCYRFSTKLAISLKNKEMFLAALDELDYAVQKEIALGEKRWILELATILAEISDDLKRYKGFKVDNSILRSFSKSLPYLQGLMQFHFNEKNYHLCRSYAKQLIAITDFLGDHEKKFEYDLEFGVSFEEEGDRRKDPLAKSHFYLEALNHYVLLKSRYPEKRALFVSRIETVKGKHRAAEAEAEYKEIKIKMPISREQIDTILDTIKAENPEGVIWNLVKSKILIPEHARSEELVTQLKRDYPLQFLFPIYIKDEEKTIASYTTEPEIFDYKIREQYRLALKLSQIFVEDIFNSFKEELNSANIVSFLEKHGSNILRENFELVETGLQMHFNGDYISAIHILVPQLERVITQIFEKKDIPTLVKEKTGLRYKELGGLLGEESAVEVFGKDLCEYLRTLLTYTDMENIRNRVCHGLMLLEEFNKSTSILLVYLILKLSVLE